MPVQYDVPCDIRFEANTPEGVLEGELPAGVHDAEALTDDARTYLDVIAVPAGIASVVSDEPAPPAPPAPSGAAPAPAPVDNNPAGA